MTKLFRGNFLWPFKENKVDFCKVDNNYYLLTYYPYSQGNVEEVILRTTLKQLSQPAFENAKILLTD